jgi:hypothetical protein
LRRELKEYEASIGDLTPDERSELREWVAAGNSVYANPGLLANEDGGPLCFIEGIRICADMEDNPGGYVFGNGMLANTYDGNF